MSFAQSACTSSSSCNAVYETESSVYKLCTSDWLRTVWLYRSTAIQPGECIYKKSGYTASYAISYTHIGLALGFGCVLCLPWHVVVLCAYFGPARFKADEGTRDLCGFFGPAFLMILTTCVVVCLVAAFNWDYIDFGYLHLCPRLLLLLLEGKSFSVPSRPSRRGREEEGA